MGIKKLYDTIMMKGLQTGFFKRSNDCCFAMKNLKDSEYYNTFVINADSLGYKFGKEADPRPEGLVKSFFAMSATMLSNAKKAKTDEAGIVEYHENTENPEEPGNWSYVTTFNEQDIINLEKKKTVNKILYSGSLFTEIFNTVSYDIGSIEWEKESYMVDGCMLVIDSLLQILDSEAKPGEVVDIEMPGYFKASVAIEDDEKIFSITPDGNMKNIIKSDVMIEK